MTIATLKKKTMATYKNHTVNRQNNIVLYSRAAGDSKENVFAGPTSAFTLNGKLRPRSYIGKTYQVSKRPGTSSYCCTDNSDTVKPVGFTSREVMRGRKLWKKRSFTRNEIPSQYEMPSNGQLQYICNNWVMTKQNNGGSLSNTDNVSGSQGFYVENKASDAILCSTKSNVAQSKNCQSNNNLCSNSRIGGKLLPLANTNPITKDISKGNPYSSSTYTKISQVRRSNKATVGYGKPFPMFFPISSYETCGVKYLQANDPNLLETYYKKGNALPNHCN